jgi:hypothetical protein
VTAFELSLQISDDMTSWSDGPSDPEVEEVLALVRRPLNNYESYEEIKVDEEEECPTSRQMCFDNAILT